MNVIIHSTSDSDDHIRLISHRKRGPPCLSYSVLSSSFYFLTVFCSDEEEEKPKKEVVPLVFKNKREAMEAFKSLLKEKVCLLNHGALLFSLNKFIEGHD